MFVEEPVPQENPDALKRIQEQVSFPLRQANAFYLAGSSAKLSKNRQFRCFNPTLPTVVVRLN
jgi:L-alanine-DL-glutamate epimerase-like enolase superfamily enzyme